MELLKKLTEIEAVTGFEELGTQELAYLLSNFCDEVTTDQNGNLFGFLRCGKKDAKLLMLEAHYDMIGFMVKEIKENGFVTFASLGGVDSRILPGLEVTIHGNREIYGIIGSKPPHILSREEMDKTLEIGNLSIDTGYSKEEIETWIPVGSPISIRNSFQRIGSNQIASRALDNRAGCYCLLKAAEALDKNALQTDVCIFFAVNEEIRRMGALTGAAAVNPDLAAVVDVTHGKTPDSLPYRASPLGKGPVLCKGPNIHRKAVEKLMETAKEQDIPYQLEVEPGDTGTDAFVIETAGEGIPCLLISIPLKYMHSGIEVIDMRDLEDTIALLQAWTLAFGAESAEKERGM